MSSNSAQAGGSSNSAYSAPSFLNYMRDSREVLVNLSKYPLIKIVMGNESCDLDSAASALAFAFLLHSESLDGSLLQGKIILPVLNIKLKELRLKTDIVYLFHKLQIPLDSIITRDDIDLEALASEGRLEIVLVDHHVLAVQDANLEGSIVQIIDHRPQCRRWNLNKQLFTIVEVGSCATLVSEKIKDRRKQEILSQNMDLAHLLYGAILLDTMNFNPDAERYKETDVRMVELLETIIIPTPGSRNATYLELLNARNNISDLSSLDCLNKDRKQAGENPVCTLNELVQDFMKRPDAVRALQELLASGHYDIVVLIGIENVGEELRRDLGFFSESSVELCSKVMHTLRSNSILKLQLEVIQHPEVPGLILCNQWNVTCTRKHLIPIIDQVVRKWKEPVTDSDD